MSRTAPGRDLVQEPAVSPRALRAMAVFAIAALLTVITVRLFGPSDIFHQTQPKTISYTSDIVARGRWILPIERGDYPATKPLLYNWLAAPFVAAAGYGSEPAHKIPSMLALVACFAAVVAVGERLMRGGGWLAAIMLLANYTIFKIGVLARPDMLLTLWLFFAWASASALLVHRRNTGERHPRRAILAAAFWLAVALAWLTKGPAALVAIVYFILGARLVAGRFRFANDFAWWFGVPLSILPFALWLVAVYRINPSHVTDTLWGVEFYGRIVGKGPAGPDEGARAILTGLLNMPVYYLIRSFPWSVLSILAMVDLWTMRGRGDEEAGTGSAPPTGDRRGWMQAAAAWTVLIIIFFSLSAGKRADYIASAFPTGALLASWWLIGIVRTGGRRPWLAPAMAAIVIGIMSVFEFLEPAAPAPRYGDHIKAFVARVDETIDAADPDRPILFWQTNPGPIQALLGLSVPEERAPLLAQLERGGSFWLLAGSPPEKDPVADLPRFLVVADVDVKRVLDSPALPRQDSWPGRVTLFLIEPKSKGGAG